MKRISCVFGVCAAMAVGLSSLAFAQDAEPAESPFHMLARKVGLAASPPAPPDFVRDERNKGPQQYVPIFRPYDEPTSKVETKDEFKATTDDLQKSDEAQQKKNGSSQSGAAKPAGTADVAKKVQKKAAKATDAPKPKPTDEN